VMVQMYHPGSTVTMSPELIWCVWIMFLAWHTWFVLMVPVV
jgi:hypothetical protein